MNTHISIKNVEISISGVPDKTVRRSFVEFDKELSDQTTKLSKGSFNLVDNLTNIDAGNIYVHQNIHSIHLRRLVAERILKSMVRETL